MVLNSSMPDRQDQKGEGTMDDAELMQMTRNHAMTLLALGQSPIGHMQRY